MCACYVLQATSSIRRTYRLVSNWLMIEIHVSFIIWWGKKTGDQQRNKGKPFLFFFVLLMNIDMINKFISLLIDWVFSITIQLIDRGKTSSNNWSNWISLISVVLRNSRPLSSSKDKFTSNVDNLMRTVMIRKKEHLISLELGWIEHIGWKYFFCNGETFSWDNMFDIDTTWFK